MGVGLGVRVGVGVGVGVGVSPGVSIGVGVGVAAGSVGVGVGAGVGVDVGGGQPKVDASDKHTSRSPMRVLAFISLPIRPSPVTDVGGRKRLAIELVPK